VFKALQRSRSVYAASSEEQPTEILLDSFDESLYSNDRVVVAFDPLDGSSVISANFSVGSIFAVFRGDTFENIQGRQILASAMAIYGPRVSLVVAVKNQSLNVFLDPQDQWRVHPTSFQLATVANTFASANLRAAQDLPAYQMLLAEFATRRMTLRYSGALVPDVYHALIKGQGCFVSPVSPKAPAKLRWLYEVAAIALIMECSGGDARDERGDTILDQVCRSMEQRTGLICGSNLEVARYVEIVRLLPLTKD